MTRQRARQKLPRGYPAGSALRRPLDKVPTLAEVEDALGAVVVNTPEERERANRVKTWAEIIKSTV